jgi:hypothetical protein
MKVVFAFLWFPVAYLTRFVFYLLLEPQINPLKHFPVVTVSHKLLLPLVPAVSSATGLNEGTVFLLIACIPGVFGFIAWELKENWRLYAANRSERIPSAVLGHHGETMRGLLRPGFHSGTVPKAYARIRREIRDAELAGRPAVIGKWEHEIEQIGVAVQAAIDREFLPLLMLDESWTSLRPQVQEVQVHVQSIVVLLTISGDTAHVELSFRHDEGTISATIHAIGWLHQLTSHQLKTLGIALSLLGELFAAKWVVTKTAGLEMFHVQLHPRRWEEHVHYWQTLPFRQSSTSTSN